MDKQIYELTVDDLLLYGAWFFPMDETVEDELTIRPLFETEIYVDAQIVVRTNFIGSDGSQYLGYIYWDNSGAVEYLKPIIILDDGSFVSFWNGLITPSWDEYSVRAKKIKLVFPISYSSISIFEIPQISGVIEGLYYLDEDKVSYIL